MTFKHRLARRLARLRNPVLVALASTGALTGCLDQVASNLLDSGDGASQGGSAPSMSAGGLPTAVTLEVGQSTQLNPAKGMELVSDGGTLSSTGEFTAPRTGKFKIKGRTLVDGRVVEDSTIVTVVAPQPTLSGVSVTPDGAKLTSGDTTTFTATGTLSDGSSVPIGVTWSSTGGSIDAGGTYTAGPLEGISQVVATHSTGKADTVLVAVSAPVPGISDPTSGPVTSDPITTTPVIGGQIDWSRPAGALPTDAASLVALNILGPTLTAAQSSAQGGMFATYESRAQQFAEYHWTTDGTGWENADYYDRALNHYALWIRTGDAKWRHRADSLAIAYRTDYLEANNYGASPHWSQLEGVFLHYWLTGDLQSRKAVVETARRLQVFLNSSPTYQYQEGRIQARAMMGALLSCLLQDTSADWCGQADRFVDNWINLQQADGSFRYRLSTEDVNSPMGQSNFMEGLRADAAIKYYYLRRQDPRILTMVTRMADYMSTQWSPTNTAFKYHSVDSTIDPSLADLNHLIVEMFGFAYKVTGQQKYRDIGDAAFDAGEPTWSPAYMASGHGEFLTESKQYNEHYYSSFRYLAFRQ